MQIDNHGNWCDSDDVERLEDTLEAIEAVLDQWRELTESEQLAEIRKALDRVK
jgi:hypothetical protein